MSSIMCSVCHQRQSSYRDMCGPCLDNCLSSTTPSPVEPTSGPALMEPGSSLLLNHPQNLVPDYLHHNTPSSHPSSSTFNAHASATVAAHNNYLQDSATPSLHLSPPLPGPTSSQVFDPLAAAEEQRTHTACTFPPSKPKRYRGCSGTTASTRGAQNLQDLPSYDASSPIINFTCGFETYQAPKWAKSKPLAVTCLANLKDLWDHFQKFFVPNEIVKVLNPNAFSFTTLGDQGSTVNPTNLIWWFSHHNSISLIYDHLRYEHSLTTTNNEQVNNSSPPLSITPTVKNSIFGSTGIIDIPLLYTNHNKVFKGIEQFGLSREPYLLHSHRGISWVAGLQWRVQPDGNTIESDFIAYHWANKEDSRDGQTHCVQTIEIWTPNGPIALISKTALCNPFHIRLVAPTKTSRLYTAVDILLREFVSQSKTVEGLSVNADFWDTLTNLRLVEHTIISSENPTEDSQTQSPLETMLVEERLELPLQAFSTEHWFGFPLVKTPTNMHYILDAFCHWSYQHSKGHHSVTNFHGLVSVVTKPEIMNINPANVWGKRNGHAAAVALMPVQHQCNLGWNRLKLPPLKTISVQLPPIKSCTLVAERNIEKCTWVESPDEYPSPLEGKLELRLVADHTNVVSPGVTSIAFA
ncbi:hypothetical protein DFH28DRAFT_1087727 [Melampsora americana]|nr:hypothetical protein DFH28DRAFT_1087727 [Melampsora americana]